MDLFGCEWRFGVECLFCDEGSVTNLRTIIISPSDQFDQFISILKVVVFVHFVCLIDFILYVPSTIFKLTRDGSS